MSIVQMTEYHRIDKAFPYFEAVPAAAVAVHGVPTDVLGN